MMRQTIAVSLILLVGIVQCARADVPGGARATYNFNTDWRVFVGDAQGADAVQFDDSAWKSVTTPYAWNEDDAFRLRIAELPTGVAWYRKHFKLPADTAGRKVFLEFQGVRFAGEFWVNGKNVGLHENGVMAIGLDITEALNPPGQDNVIAARIDSSWTYRERATNTPYQWNDRNFNVPYGGINKSVLLHVADKLYQTLPLFSNLGTTGVYIYGKDFDIKGKAATIHAEAQVRNEHTQPRTFSYEVNIEHMDGRIVKTINGGNTTIAPGETKTVAANARVDQLNFWSWGYGYLYNVYTTLKVDGQPVDTIKTRTGFRKTEFANGMVKINDRAIHLKGYAQRTTNEWPGVGVDMPPWVSDFSNALMVKSNGNLVRWMHVTPSKQDVESCDRVGLMQAMPAGDAEADTTGRRWENRVLLMRDATIYNRNNPSIIMYESGNEAISEPHMAEMIAVRDQYDPHGGRAAGCREMLNSKIAEWGGEMLYINKSARHPLWMTEYSRDEGLRKYWDEFSPPFHKEGEGPLYNNQSATAYNRNQDMHAVENVIRWHEHWTERPGTGRRVNAGGANIIFSDTNTHSRGAENYRRSGEVDAMRIPKDGFFAHQVMWNGWVETEQHGIHVIGHWNYQPGVRKPVYVVSTADKVELLINGQSKGFGQQSNRFLFTFNDIEWQPGTLTAVGYDAGGKKLVETLKKTAGAPAAVKLTLMTGEGGLNADQSDLALIEVEVVDAEGNRCPTALNLINFDLTGPAEWRGGIGQGPNNYILSKALPVECGVNRAFIRSTRQAGTIVVTANSEGLKPATIELESKPVEVRDGLSLFKREVGTKAHLERGPTPLTDSLRPTRRALNIVSATAGSNADRAAMSFDDNELTSWSNDGSRSTAWVRYELGQASPVSEVTLKFANFRNAAYPVRIFVDGTLAYTGQSQRSLGYNTFAFKPVSGKTIRIEVTGAALQGDAFAEIIEVAGHKEADAPTTAPAGRRGGGGGGDSFGIIEFEAYAPLEQRAGL